MLVLSLEVGVMLINSLKEIILRFAQVYITNVWNIPNLSVISLLYVKYNKHNKHRRLCSVPRNAGEVDVGIE